MFESKVKCEVTFYYNYVVMDVLLAACNVILSHQCRSPGEGGTALMHFCFHIDKKLCGGKVSVM